MNEGRLAECHGNKVKYVHHSEKKPYHRNLKGICCALPYNPTSCGRTHYVWKYEEKLSRTCMPRIKSLPVARVGQIWRHRIDQQLLLNTFKRNWSRSTGVDRVCNFCRWITTCYRNILVHRLLYELNCLPFGSLSPITFRIGVALGWATHRRCRRLWTWNGCSWWK